MLMQQSAPAVLRVMMLTGPKRVLLEYNQVFEVTRDASFINAPIHEDEDDPKAGPVTCEDEIADTTTPQVHVALTTVILHHLLCLKRRYALFI